MKKSHRIPFMTSGGYMQMYPETREEALEQGARYYHKTPVNDNPCRRPGHLVGALIHARTNIHICCSQADFTSDYDKAKTNGEPVTQKDAKEKGFDYYWRCAFDIKCGHSGKRTIDDKCCFCETEKINKEISPRQKAIAAGEEWYMPALNDPCKNGHVALRRITNGECKECSKRVERETPVYDLYPDMIVDRETAKSLGFTAYRTGKSCRQGHTGWRYLANNCCIQCQKGL